MDFHPLMGQQPDGPLAGIPPEVLQRLMQQIGGNAQMAPPMAGAMPNIRPQTDSNMPQFAPPMGGNMPVLPPQLGGQAPPGGELRAGPPGLGAGVPTQPPGVPNQQPQQGASPVPGSGGQFPPGAAASGLVPNIPPEVLGRMLRGR